MEVKKTRGPRKRRDEITAENYMEFSAKELFLEIEKLRNMPDTSQLRKQNTVLKRKLTNIAKIAGNKGEE